MGFTENQLVVSYGIGIEDPGLILISLPAVKYAGQPVDRPGGDLNMYGARLENRPEPMQIFSDPPDFQADLYGFSPSKIRTSSNLEKSTEGVTSMYWKMPGRFRSTWVIVPAINPLGKIPPRLEVMILSPT